MNKEENSAYTSLIHLLDDHQVDYYDDQDHGVTFVGPFSTDYTPYFKERKNAVNMCGYVENRWVSIRLDFTAGKEKDLEDVFAHMMYLVLVILMALLDVVSLQCTIQSQSIIALKMMGSARRDAMN